MGTFLIDNSVFAQSSQHSFFLCTQGRGWCMCVDAVYFLHHMIRYTETKIPKVPIHHELRESRRRKIKIENELVIFVNLRPRMVTDSCRRRLIPLATIVRNQLERNAKYV